MVVRLTTGLLGSLLFTRTALFMGPVFPVVSTVAVIVPFSPGFRWPELAIAAVHPQEAERLLIIRVSVPAFLKWNSYVRLEPSTASPKSWDSLSKTMAGSAKATPHAGRSRRKIRTAALAISELYHITSRRGVAAPCSVILNI